MVVPYNPMSLNLFAKMTEKMYVMLSLNKVPKSIPPEFLSEIKNASEMEGRINCELYFKKSRAWITISSAKIFYTIN